MPSATSTKTIRLSRDRLSAAGPVLAKLGLEPRAAIELFLTHVTSRKAIPFSVALADSDYAAAEYGLSKAEVAAAGKRMRKASRAAHRLGSVRPVTDIASLRE
ncbi:MAG TPA: type II toxin-antitoxin system RelB/DinJ family antitoxin [Candidatus Didemnitutus sp.]|jgi:antitoxin component of RelBE/YafQ-DinJ toxin-antitoxin module